MPAIISVPKAMPHKGRVSSIERGKKCGSCRPTTAKAVHMGGNSVPSKKRLAPGSPLSHAPRVVGTNKTVSKGQRAR